MSDKKIVQSHEKIETESFAEVIPEHIDRKEASQSEFDKAKRFLTKLYGGKRCIVCEMRGEKFSDIPGNQIESHHVFEWCHSNEVKMKKVEVVLRTLSPFIHGLYLMSEEDILAGKPLISLWDHEKFKGKPFTTLDDARNQFFLCTAHHQQATKEMIEAGFDIIGLHHMAWVLWLLYFVLPSGKYPVHHIDKDHHDDGLDRKV